MKSTTSSFVLQRTSRMPPDPLSPAEHALRVLEGHCDDEVRRWMDRKRGNYTVLEARSRLAMSHLRRAKHSRLTPETVAGMSPYGDFEIYYDDPVDPETLVIIDAETGNAVTSLEAKQYVRDLLIERTAEPSPEEIAEIRADRRYHEMKDEGML